MPVTLESRLRRMQVFNLPHESNCRDHCACSELALTVVDQNPRTGERAPRRVIKRVSESVTLLALERRSGFPASVLEAPEMRVAIARGHVRVREHTPELPTPRASSPSPASSSAPAPPSGTAPAKDA